MTDKQKIKQEIEKEIGNIKRYIYHPSLAGHAKRDMTVVYETLNKLLQFIDSLPEEHNEDLEEEIENYIKDSLAIKFPTTDKEQIKADIRYIAHHFAEWQKKKDQETIELAEDHAMLAGMNRMKEEMMKDAADSKITTDGNSIFPIIKYQLPLTYDCKIGDKVKLIIIKEEEK